MDASRLPPETPRRQLLKRIHRRSSVLPSTDVASHLAPSTSASTSRSNSRRASLNPDSVSPLIGSGALEKHDEEEEDHEDARDDEDHAQTGSYANDAAAEYEDGGDGEDGEVGDENGEQAAWAQVDELMDTVQLKNQRILDLEKALSQAQRDLQAEKDRIKPASKANSAASQGGSESGLTRAAAIKLEREFLSQEMILKGLQRDNEDKTLEVEALRRKVKIMSDFLASQYGADDWEAVVFGSTGAATGSATKDGMGSPEKESLSAVARMLSAANASSPRATNRAKFTSALGGDTSMNPFSPDASSPSKTPAAMNKEDMVIPTIARLQTPASSPSKMFVSSFGDAPADEDQPASSAEADAAAPTARLAGTGLQAGLDPNMLLASIESVRLLIQGFERKNAMRRAELENTIDNAIQAERRAERLQAAAASAAAHETVGITA